MADVPLIDLVSGPETGGAEPGEQAPRRPRRELDLSGLNPAQYEAVTMPPGPGPRGRRSRLGQDPGAHPPARVPRRRARRLAVRGPRDHVHQQGRGRDARAGRRARRARSPGACGCRPSTRRAPGSCAGRPRCSATGRASRSTTRPTRCASPTGSAAISTSTRSGSRPARSTRRSAALKNELVLPAEYARDGRRPGRAPALRDLHRVPAPAPGSVGGRLRRSARARGAVVPRAPRSARAVPQALPARARRRVPGHQRRAVGARAPPHRTSTAA